MKMHFYKYQGTGNDFVMIDNRSIDFPKKNKELVARLCDRRFGIGADGLILLDPSETTDFKMVYYNADGNESSMCGNGGRCIVAFAKQLGIIQEQTTFDAVDGLHEATIKEGIVSLRMIDIDKIDSFEKHTFIDTGSPHHVEFRENVDSIDVKSEGAEIRNGAPYHEAGSNVNFAMQKNENSFKVRTFERGVEDETLACGTGVTAVALAAHRNKLTNSNAINLEVMGGNLEVSFIEKDGSYTEVYLTGPAKLVFEGTFDI